MTGSWIGALPRLIVRLAARRWPRSQRPELVAEWTAELAAIEGAPGRAPARAGRALAFGVSLCRARLGYPAARRWWPLPVWVAGPVVALAVFGFVAFAADTYDTLAEPTDVAGYQPWVALIAALALLALVPAGRATGRRGATLPEFWAILLPAAGLAAGTALYLNPDPAGEPLGLLLGALPLCVAGRAVLVLVRSGRRVLAGTVAVAGTMATVAAGTATALATHALGPAGAPLPFSPYLLLGLAAFALGYLWRTGGTGVAR